MPRSLRELDPHIALIDRAKPQAQRPQERRQPGGTAAQAALFPPGWPQGRTAVSMGCSCRPGIARRRALVTERQRLAGGRRPFDSQRAHAVGLRAPEGCPESFDSIQTFDYSNVWSGAWLTLLPWPVLLHSIGRRHGMLAPALLPTVLLPCDPSQAVGPNNLEVAEFVTW